MVKNSSCRSSLQQLHKIGCPKPPLPPHPCVKTAGVSPTAPNVYSKDGTWHNIDLKGACPVAYYLKTGAKTWGKHHAAHPYSRSLDSNRNNMRSFSTKPKSHNLVLLGQQWLIVDDKITPFCQNGPVRLTWFTVTREAALIQWISFSPHLGRYTVPRWHRVW